MVSVVAGRTARVVVVGAGMSGAACARELAAAGLDVSIVERGRAPGGRMASPVLHGRRTDLGAAYFTAKDDSFAALVRDWTERGLAREWTDTFTVVSGEERHSTTGPMRYATPDGLRSLVRDVLPDDVPVTYEREVTMVDDFDADAVVLAMPDPQARRLVPDATVWLDFEPVISVAAGWDLRHRDDLWPQLDAAFVNDDPEVTLVVDDGARRGDGAPVLVAHSTSDVARAHLDDPRGATAPVVRAVQKALRFAQEPEWVHAHRWTFAKPVSGRAEPFGVVTRGGRLLGLGNDSWSPSGAPRIESAWLSGRALGRELSRRLG